MVNWLQHYGKRILSFICSLGNFLFRGNFATCFFRWSNDKWECAFNTNILTSYFTFYYFLTQSYFFSLTTRYGIPFLHIQTTNYFFYLNNCSIINISL